MQTFAAFFSTPDQMLKLFQTSGSNSNLQSRRSPYRVDYFRSRDEYVQRLINKVPQIGMTNGLYFTADRVAYFYYDPQQQNQDTLFHEATHQLFYENERRDRMIAMDANFWIVEGIACYMESYHVENGQSIVGDPKHVRIRRPGTAGRRQLLHPAGTVRRDGDGGLPVEPANLQELQPGRGAGRISSCTIKGAGTATRSIEHLSEIYRAGPRHGWPFARWPT